MRRGGFWRENRGTAVITLLPPLLFLAVMLLYGLDTEPFLYALFLHILISGGVWALLYARHIRRKRRRADILISVKNGCAQLPGTDEGEWADVTAALTERIRALTDERVNERKETRDYYAMWVHQIKTPIAALRMLLQTEGAPEAMEAELFRVERYAEMALEYQRLDDSAGDLSFREQPLDGLIRSCVRKYAPVFIEKKLSVNYAGTDMTVLTDGKWLCFIIEQLLSNAVKYTSQGGVTITVTDDRRIVIADTGIGIDPADLPRIFEKGFTGVNGRLERGATGLGLYLCRRAAEKLSVKLTAESGRGGGTAFTIDLNVSPAETD